MLRFLCDCLIIVAIVYTAAYIFSDDDEIYDGYEWVGDHFDEDDFIEPLF